MTDTLDGLIDQLQTYVVSPLNAFGIGGFIFDCEGESTARNTAEITDHYIEDNEATQDHIALRPTKIVLKGYQGEVIYNVPSPDDNTPLQQAVQKLTTISAFLPDLSAVEQQFVAFSPAAVSDVSLNDAANIYGLVKNVIASINGSEARQQQAYNYFVALQKQKMLMGIQTPWVFLTNMAVEEVVAIQDEKTQYITDFSVTFKQIRIAKTQLKAYQYPGNQSDNILGYNGNYPPVLPVQSQELEGAASLQAQDPVQIGNVPGVDPSSSAAPTGPGTAPSPTAVANDAALYATTIKASDLQPP